MSASDMHRFVALLFFDFFCRFSVKFLFYLEAFFSSKDNKLTFYVESNFIAYDKRNSKSIVNHWSRCEHTDASFCAENGSFYR